MVSLHAVIAAMVLSSTGQTVLLDFYADWCGPCRQMNPTVDALIAAGYPVQRVNFDKNRALAAKYGVQSLPSFVMVANGRVIDRTVGKTSYTQLERMCKAGAASVPPPSPLSINPSVMLADLLSAAPSVASAPAQVTMPLPNAAPSSEVSDAALLAASVRLRIEDPDGRSCGSGTIIDCRAGEALILTCGHIFRDSKGQGRIEVDLFGAGEPQPVAGRLVSYNLTNDVGLVAIRVPGRVGVARLAPPGYRVAPGAAVASVGCNNGDRPTVRRSRINGLNRYQGPANIQVAGQPVEGRSGGGLFTSEGYVIGVCNAADPKDQEGLFAAPELILAELDRDQLAFIYQSPSMGEAAPSAPSPAPLLPDSAAVGSPPMPGPMSSSLPDPISRAPMPGPADLASSGFPPPSAVVPVSANESIGGRLRPAEQAAWEELQRSRKQGSEVVCIIRPQGDANAKSQVIVLDHVSREFVEKLSADGRPRERTHIETSLELPKPRKVLLEWTAPGNRG